MTGFFQHDILIVTGTLDKLPNAYPLGELIQKENAMNCQKETFSDRKDPVILDFRGLIRTERNEILEHVVKQVIDARDALGYSRMYHRHSRTSGRH